VAKKSSKIESVAHDPDLPPILPPIPPPLAVPFATFQAPAGTGAYGVGGYVFTVSAEGKILVPEAALPEVEVALVRDGFRRVYA
jgi:hypothetical protein